MGKYFSLWGAPHLQSFKSISVLRDWLSREGYYLVLRIWMWPKHSTQTPLLLWMVPHGCPNDLQFQKSIYTQVSPLLQWIILLQYCRLVPKTSSCNDEAYPVLIPGLLFTIYSYCTFFNTFNTVYLSSSTPVNCNDLECRVPQESMSFLLSLGPHNHSSSCCVMEL